MPIINLFPSKIYTNQIENFEKLNKILKDYALGYKKKNPIKKESEIFGFEEDYKNASGGSRYAARCARARTFNSP